MSCPYPELVGASIQDQMISPEVRAIGEIWWSEEFQQFRCLADVEGSLCIISLKVTPDAH